MTPACRHTGCERVCMPVHLLVEQAGVLRVTLEPLSWDP